ncbi:aspartate carbamoyltransferase [Candidatus Micrarchaeota archaeon]|nr:aspartate carbamoyltransferase [Candidatus Micrarchaeota archaeon]
MNAWKGQDVISTMNWEREAMESVLATAEKMNVAFRKKQRSTTLNGTVMASLFFEPSTRTRVSFKSAMRLLGGEETAFGDPKTSSSAKGESLYDTVKALETQVDVFVIRHPNEGAAAWAAANTDVPVINAGDGNNQHPTQALLDLFTIQQNKKKLDGLTVLLAGDLKYGRTVHSLAYALSKFDGITLQFYSPSTLRMPSFMLKDLREFVKVQELDSMNLADADVIYATRIQKERISDPEEYRKASYRIDLEVMKHAKEDAILMHPLPRVDEIAVEVDRDPRAKYLEQESNGVPVRMAVLSMILGDRS